MLYDDDSQKDPRHVISLGLYGVSIYGGGESIPEGELYIRRNAICLRRRDAAVDPALDEPAGLPFFFFSENCSNKEDFYLALVKHQDKSPEDPAVPPRPLRYRQADVISLVQRLEAGAQVHCRLRRDFLTVLEGAVLGSMGNLPAQLSVRYQGAKHLRR